MNLNEYATKINETSTAHGFWPEEGRNFGEMIALAHSELSEALEEHRGGNTALWFRHSEEECVHSSLNHLHDLTPRRDGCTCTPKPEGTAVELADCIIRCLDTLHSLGVDIDMVVQKKMDYNNSRPFKHGKAY